MLAGLHNNGPGSVLLIHKPRDSLPHLFQDSDGKRALGIGTTFIEHSGYGLYATRHETIGRLLPGALKEQGGANTEIATAEHRA